MTTERTVSAPYNLHLPQFTYSTKPQGAVLDCISVTSLSQEQESSQPFMFSALFLSSPVSANLTGPRETRTDTSVIGLRSAMRENTENVFVGFTWGPTQNAFGYPPGKRLTNNFETSQTQTPRPKFRSAHSTPLPRRAIPAHGFVTPLRRGYDTLPPASTLLKSSERRRGVSDREAMQQLAQCIGASARKKILASGRTPRILPSSASVQVKHLRFDAAPRRLSSNSSSFLGTSVTSSILSTSQDKQTTAMDDSESEVVGPPSPSPSPRPNSALSRRSSTPVISTPSWRRDGSSRFSPSISTSHRTIHESLASVSPERRKIPTQEGQVSMVNSYNSLETSLIRKHTILMDEIRQLSQKLAEFTAHGEK